MEFILYDFMSRNAFLLTTDISSDRTISSKHILESIGFHIESIVAIPRKEDSYFSKIESNRNSMKMILGCIADQHPANEFYYIFEDDIACLEPILLEEIIQYENISTGIFYLGCCRTKNPFTYQKTLKTEHLLNGYPVYRAFGNIRGAHAFAVTPICAMKILEFIDNTDFYDNIVFDEILEMYIYNHTDGVHIVRYDLESCIEGHRGIIYQDRTRFPTSIV